MSKPVVTSDRAERQIAMIDGWWREHRDKAPDLFEEELADVSRLIGFAPRAGKRVQHPTEVLRRVLMRKTRHHVYYVEREQYVFVVAVWGTVKGSEPDLADI
ncbi:MAG: type II toxin-antitoxin system RelE/ParE family toxin [Myxococcales bacterium]|nr:type II toxin-antitoxin system RelE/ParE family toxin [Myxococcales bacterium]